LASVIVTVVNLTIADLLVLNTELWLHENKLRNVCKKIKRWSRVTCQYTYAHKLYCVSSNTEQRSYRPITTVYI